MTKTSTLRELIKRLGRLDAADTWRADLNPAQVSALGYLARANRFSRAPSHVADYLGTTRGTMSQTLKALERKGYVAEARSETDKRSIRYDLTPEGWAVTSQDGALDSALADLDGSAVAGLEAALSEALKAMIAANGGKAFGQCRTCSHHVPGSEGARCALLNVPLLPEEADQICHEHRATA